MSDKNYKSSKLIKRKKKIFIFKIVTFIILTILVISGISYFSNSEIVKISNIEINDTKFFDKKEILTIVDEELKNSHLMIFGKDNILLLPRHTIEKRIKEYHNSIEKVTVSLSGLKSISINIKEYNPVAVWCSGEECYYINDSGLVFIKTSFDYDKNLVKFHDWIHDDPLGKIYTDAETFKKMMTLINLVAKVPLKVVSVNTEDGLTFFLYTDSNTRLLYEINDDPEEVANNLNTVIEKDAINRAQLNNIDYIDLRFGNKVYYKIR